MNSTHGLRVLLRGNGKVIVVKCTHVVNSVLGITTFTSLDGTPIVVAHDMYEILEKF